MLAASATPTARVGDLQQEKMGPLAGGLPDGGGPAGGSRLPGCRAGLPAGRPRLRPAGTGEPEVYEGVVQDLIDELGRLPGVGPKGAQRIAFHLLPPTRPTYAGWPPC